MSANGNTQIYRIGLLEKGQEELDKKVEKIMINDIPKLHERMISLQTRMNVLTAVNIGAIAVGIILTRILK